MGLAPHEFIRLLHVLPDGLHRIRHYGFLANGERGGKLAYVRDLLQVQRAQEPDDGAQARRRVPSQRQTPLTNRSPSARIAAASCAAWSASRRTNPAPFAATHHDDEGPPDPDRFRIPTPPRHCAAGAEVQRVVRSPSARFGLDRVVVAAARTAQTLAPECSKRSAIDCRRLRNACLAFKIKTASALSP
jgi:hypothetical protein